MSGVRGFKVGDRVRVARVAVYPDGRSALGKFPIGHEAPILSLDEDDWNGPGTVGLTADLLDARGIRCAISVDCLELAFTPVALREQPVKADIPGQPVRTFDTGATRNVDTSKLDYEGFLSPLALRRYAEYMNTHRMQSDGTLRSSDNWQKGIPRDVYVKSMLRHVMDVWLIHDGHDAISPDSGEEVGLEEALCAVIFNAMGLLYEALKEEEEQ